jgi:serine/threonine-protein kinase
MGEVYRARDTRLNRDVAIKVLPESFAGDAERLARLNREAQVLAALNHPHIAHIHGLEESNGVRALVLELVEGEDLAQRIARGPIPTDEALPIARQIAEALEAAHEQGIIHRDLKPANIKVRPDGTVKVLDFGLAKAMDPAMASTANAMNSPTLSMHATQAGIILGTAAYMSPEQAAGKPVDKRSDLWAFGVVLLEMLTGRPTFGGETTSHVLAAVLKDEPDWTTLPVATPQAIRRLLRRCLEKDRKRRLADAADAKLEIDDALSASVTGDNAPTPLGAAARSRTSYALPWLIAVAAMLVVAAVSVGWWRAARPTSRPLMRFTEQETAVTLDVLARGSSVAISPDGLRLAYIVSGGGTTHLSVRRLDNSVSTLLSGTEGAGAPFFSPDSRSIAFFTQQGLKKISVEGGAAIAVADVGVNPRGGAWGVDGNILFANQRTPLLRVSATGGPVRPATVLDQQKAEVSHRFAQLLPGGEAFLFTAGRDNNQWDDATVNVQSIKTGERKTLVEGGYFGRFLPGGYLLYVHGNSLFAAPMDVDRLALTGPAIPVLEDVGGRATNGFASLDLSASGMVVYVGGASVSSELSLFWIDPSGKLQRLSAQPGQYYGRPRPSPDGARLAVVRTAEGSSANLWVYDWAQNRMTRLTFLKSGLGGAPGQGTWTPDGKHVVFAIDSHELSGAGIYWVRADGAGEPQRLLAGDNLRPSSWSPDGKRLLYTSFGADYGIWMLPVDVADSERPAGAKPELFLSSKIPLLVPVFSPDGRWVAYSAQDSGESDVFVRPVRGAGKWQVSTAGGATPMWSAAAHELFYLRQGKIFVASYTATADSFAAGQPRVWAESAPTLRSIGELMPNGKRVVAALPTSAGSATESQLPHVTFLLNFVDEVRRRSSEGK